MKKNQYFVLFLIGLLSIPMMSIRGATPSSAQVLVISSLNADSSVNSIDLSGNGEYLVASTEGGATTGNVSVLEIPGSFTTTMDAKWNIPQESARSVTITEDGTRLVYVDTDEDKLYCLSPSSVTPIWELTADDSIMEDIDMSDNGEYVVYWDVDVSRVIHCVQGDDKTPVWNYDIGVYSVDDFEMADNGNTAVILSNNTLMYFNIGGLAWQKDLVHSLVNVEISNGGQILVSTASATENMTLYDATGTEIWKIEGQEFSNIGYDIAKDTGDIIISTYGALENKIWGHLGGSLTPTWTLSMDTSIQRAIISDNGKTALVRQADDQLLLIDMATGEIIAKHPFTSIIIDLALSEDGSIGAALSKDGTIVVYSISSSMEDAAVPTFLEKYLNSFTNLDNVFALGSVGLVAFILGAVIFGVGKKKGKKKSKSDE